jgi:hypothetical protein
LSGPALHAGRQSQAIETRNVIDVNEIVIDNIFLEPDEKSVIMRPTYL